MAVTCLAVGVAVGLLGESLDGRQAFVPPFCGSCDGGAGLVEAFLADGVADFAAASVGGDEAVAFEDGEVL